MRYATIEIYEQSDDLRLAPRSEKDAGATVRASERTPIEARLVDISTHGAGFESSAAMTIGASISIGVAGIGQQRATIVRRDGNRYGCAFDLPISMEQVAIAGAENTIVFPGTAGHEATPPHVESYSPRVKLAILFGGAAAGWALVFAIGKAIF